MKPVAGALALALVLANPACASGTNRTLTVFAASSLTNAFEPIATAFETANPGVTVRLSFAGSTALARQIRDGAPADVFAAADPESMQQIDAPDGPRVFARNRLAIAVQRGNPASITGPADLARERLIVVTCAPEVPCGRRTAEMLVRASTTITPASLEDSVRSVLTKVASGEADAGIVYETDIRAGDSVDRVRLSSDVNVVSDYPITVLRRGDGRAKDFVDFVLSEPAQRILRDHGFLAP